MNEWAEQVEFVRSIKGAAASILWILLLSGRSLTGEELQLATGYSDKPITKAMELLELRGFVQYNGRRHGWSLPAEVAQLPLPFSRLPDGLDRRNSDLSSSSPSSSYMKTSRQRLEEDDEIVPGDRRISDLGGEVDRKVSDLGNGVDRRNSDLSQSVDDAVEKLCRAAGVGRSMSKRLASCEWVTPEYVQAHLAKMERDDEPLRFAIQRMKEGDPAPDVQSDPYQEWADVIKR